jgi:hypothetical protein
VGKPRFAYMHPARQRATMALLRCQKCHGQPSRTELGYLFLEMAGDRADIEGMTTAQPPVCLAHAAEGIERCKHLIDQGALLVRSRVPRLYGVVGRIYVQGPGGVEPLPPLLGPDGSDTPIPYTNRKLTPWVLASQLVRQLCKVTVVDIEQEIAAAAAQRTGASR